MLNINIYIDIYKKYQAIVGIMTVVEATTVASVSIVSLQPFTVLSITL